MTVSVENLTVRYGTTLALNGVTLAIAESERLAIMGPSGSGKSSLIRAIAGIVPSTGQVVIGGADVTHLPAHERPIGLMFQDYALFPHLNVRDNIAYGLRMAGIPKPERNRVVADLLGQVELEGLGERKVGELSGGQQQRVALARTLAPSPGLVMLDEPLGSLDLDLRETLLNHTRQILDTVGATAIYVTHDRSEAFAFADRVAVLIGGRIAALDTPEGLWANPVTVEVARLIGHANVVDGSAIGVGGWVAIPASAVRIVDDGGLMGTVVGSVFSEGDFDTTVEINATELHTTTQHAMDSGTRVGITIDQDQTIRLDQTPSPSARS